MIPETRIPSYMLCRLIEAEIPGVGHELIVYYSPFEFDERPIRAARAADEKAGLVVKLPRSQRHIYDMTDDVQLLESAYGKLTHAGREFIDRIIHDLKSDLLLSTMEQLT